MSLAELNDRMYERFRLLTGAEQLLLGRLSLFAGAFDLTAAEAVCRSGDLDVLDVADLVTSPLRRPRERTVEMITIGGNGDTGSGNPCGHHNRPSDIRHDRARGARLFQAAPARRAG
jgi:hypothetical protein